MSAEAQSWAAQVTAGGPGPKLLLLALANIADVSGVTFAGRALLAERCECRPATVSANMKVLEEAGLVVRFERRRKNGSRSSDWTVLAPLLAERGLMVDASGEEYPAAVAEKARRSGAVSEPEIGGSGAVSGPGQVRFSGRPEQEGEQSASSLDGKKKARGGARIIPTAEEPVGFSQWLGYHHEITGRSVPRAGTQTRSDLARLFATLAGQGYELEDFKAVTDFGHLDPYWADRDLTLDWHLRLGAFGERVESGRRLKAAAAAAPTETVDWSRFDG